MPLRYNISSASGTFDGIAIASQVNGAALVVGDGQRLKLKGISALVTVDCETSTFTATAKWQVSNDNSTYVDVSNGTQNAAGVVLATGTGGADAAVTKCISAPEAVYGWKYCRLSLVAGGTTGTTSDTYSIGYCGRSVRGID